MVKFMQHTNNKTIAKIYVYGILSAHRKSEAKGMKEPFSETGSFRISLMKLGWV
jgi:hypothetical protein